MNGVLEWARRQVVSRVPKADLDQRDPDYIRDQLPLNWLMASLYFRADVRSLDRIPAEGPVLLVGNHSGGNVPPDTFVFTLAFCSHFGVERPFYQLAHNLVVSAPPLGFLRKFGTVAANRENARLTLDSGAALLIDPGGDYEVFRPSWERHKVDFGGRMGYVRLAREAGVPIVPVASVAARRARCSSTAGNGWPSYCWPTSCCGSRAFRYRWPSRGASTSATWRATSHCRRRS